MKKTKRNEEIRRLRLDGLLTLQEIADKYGITRERVRQICGNHGWKIVKKKNEIICDYINNSNNKTNSQLSNELNLSLRSISSRRSTRHLIADGSAGFGYSAEEDVTNILSSMGYEVDGMRSKHPYDLLVNGVVRVDVKSTCSPYPTAPGLINPQYHFKVRANTRDKCDIYICVIYPSKDIFIIPSWKVPAKMDHIVFCWPTDRPDLSKWQHYHNRFDIIDATISRLSMVV